MDTTLNNFGDLIQHLEIKMWTQFTDKVLEHLNTHPPKSLQTLYFIECDRNALVNFKKPLPSIKTFWFSISSKWSGGGLFGQDTKLIDIFPNVNKLHTEHSSYVDQKFINSEFLHLRSFDMDFSDNNKIAQTDFLSFLRNNKKIDDLTIHNSNLLLLKETNEILPNLQKLSIESFSKNYSNYDGDFIHYKNVKELNITSENKNKLPQNIIFDQVEILTINFDYDFTSKWIDIINVQIYSKLKEFKLNTNGLRAEQLLFVTKDLTNLENVEISIKHAWGSNSNTFLASDIIKFIEGNKHLKTLKLYIRIDDEEQDKLYDKLKSHWKVDFKGENDKWVYMNFEK